MRGPSLLCLHKGGLRARLLQGQRDQLQRDRDVQGDEGQPPVSTGWGGGEGLRSWGSGWTLERAGALPTGDW